MSINKFTYPSIYRYLDEDNKQWNKQSIYNELIIILSMLL